jgi:hypothetical protein
MAMVMMVVRVVVSLIFTCALVTPAAPFLVSIPVFVFFVLMAMVPSLGVITLVLFSIFFRLAGVAILIASSV